MVEDCWLCRKSPIFQPGREYESDGKVEARGKNGATDPMGAHRATTEALQPEVVDETATAQLLHCFVERVCRPTHIAEQQRETVPLKHQRQYENDDDDDDDDDYAQRNGALTDSWPSWVASFTY